MMHAVTVLCLFGMLAPLAFAKRMIVCEGYYGLLTCPAGSAILVDSITIGCTDNLAYCTSGDKLPNEGLDLDQLPKYDGLRLSEVCNNRRNCSVDATRIREKCVGKYTFLHVKYGCLPLATVCINEHGNDRECDNWSHGDWAKEKGSECFMNPWWMSKNCFKSCTGCNAECMNYGESDTTCDLKAMLGHCESYRDEVNAICEKSCQTCEKKGQGECVNKKGDKECTEWAGLGDCETSALFMSRNCRKACKMCYKKCKDIWGDRYCQEQAAAGNCATNSAFLYKACSKSCKMCPKTMDDCVNLDGDAKCVDLAKKGQCWKDPVTMYIRCKKACLCHTGAECINHLLNDDECERKKVKGECQSSPGYTYYNCKRTCGFC